MREDKCNKNRHCTFIGLGTIVQASSNTMASNEESGSEDEGDWLENTYGQSERSSMMAKIDGDVGPEWSFRSSYRDLGIGRTRRASYVMENAQKDEKPPAITGPRSSSMHLDQKQFDLLKGFLFESNSELQGRTSATNVLSSLGVGTESIFENSFDLTEDRLRRLFASFDGNNNGTINYEELKLGFAYHGAELGMSDRLDDKTFSALVSYLDADNSGEITFEEFSEGLRLLMLRTILQQVERSGEHNSDSVMTQVFDYNIGMLDRYLLKGRGHISKARASFVVVRSKLLVDFFLEERGDAVSVRWINITGKKASNIMRMMALKYRLHPLALEDALECADHRPKADMYDGHYFIMVPVFYLKDEDDEKVKPSSPRRMSLLQPTTSWWQKLFRSEPKTKESDTSSSDEEPKDSEDENFIGVHMTSIFITKPSGRTVITFNNEHNEEYCWSKLQDELNKDYSKLRQYDGQYFAYRLLDETVDKIGEVVKKLKKIIREEKKKIVREKYQNLERIHSLKNEMYSMSRKFKPFLRLLGHIIEDKNFSPGASIYLRDVLDNLEIHDDDIKVLIALCDAVDAEDEKRQAQQMDSTLYTLTVFTVTILPAQFLTGVWGMNFANMPELNYKYGYLLFWLLAISLSVITVCILNFGRRSRNY